MNYLARTLRRGDISIALHGKRFYSASIIFLLAACSAQPVQLNPSYEFTTASKGYPVECSSVIQLSDGRRSTISSFKILSEKEAMRWLREGIGSRTKHAAAFTNTESDPAAFELSLERAYVKHIATSMSGIVVLRAQRNGEHEYYRGQAPLVNWWGAKREYTHALNRALDIALDNFAIDVDRWCLEEAESEAGKAETIEET